MTQTLAPERSDGRWRDAIATFGTMPPCESSERARALANGERAQGTATELLDWTGRQIHVDEAGVIPEHLAPILSRIGLDSQAWCDVVKKFGRMFKRATGTPESSSKEARKRGQRWVCALPNAMTANRSNA